MMIFSADQGEPVTFKLQSNKEAAMHHKPVRALSVQNDTDAR